MSAYIDSEIRDQSSPDNSLLDKKMKLLKLCIDKKITDLQMIQNLVLTGNISAACKLISIDTPLDKLQIDPTGRGNGISTWDYQSLTDYQQSLL